MNRFTELYLETISFDPMSDDPEYRKKLSTLKLTAQQVARKRAALAGIGISLHPFDSLVARVNFIIDQNYGRDTIERLTLENTWLTHLVLPSLEAAHNQVVQERSAKKIHIPGKGIRLVPNSDTNGAGKEDDPETN